MHFIGEQKCQEFACLGGVCAVCPDCRKYIYLRIGSARPIWEWQEFNICTRSKGLLDHPFEPTAGRIPMCIRVKAVGDLML